MKYPPAPTINKVEGCFIKKAHPSITALAAMKSKGLLLGPCTLYNPLLFYSQLDEVAR